MSVALITGASQGLGLALARELAHQGWELVIDARGADALHAVAAELGPQVHPVVGDISDSGHREELAWKAHSIGRLDLLVNNAGTLGPSPLPALADYPLYDLARVFEINTIAPLGLIQEVLPLLTASGGAVVNLSSDAAVEPYEGWGGYGASKAALDHLTAVLAAETAAVRFYAFDPGDMRTAMHQAAFPGEDISDRPEAATVVPALLRLLDERPQSGRYRASDHPPVVTAGPALVGGVA